MSLIHILATIQFSEEQVKDAQQKLLEILSPSRAESGNISYLLFQDQTDQQRFIFQEIWENADAFEKHQKSPHFLQLVNYLNTYAQSVDIRKLSSIDVISNEG